MKINSIKGTSIENWKNTYSCEAKEKNRNLIQTENWSKETYLAAISLDFIKVN